MTVPLVHEICPADVSSEAEAASAPCPCPNGPWCCGDGVPGCHARWREGRCNRAQGAICRGGCSARSTGAVGQPSRAQSFRAAGGHRGCRTGRPSLGSGCPCCCSEEPAGTPGLPVNSHVCGVALKHGGCRPVLQPAEWRGEAHRQLVPRGHLGGMKSGPGGTDKRPGQGRVWAARRSSVGPSQLQGRLLAALWKRVMFYPSVLFSRASVLLGRLWLGCTLPGLQRAVGGVL